jgi:hypothetical protein
MRLLRPYDNGEFGLVETRGENIYKYAILSHTWGPDGEEVTYEDVLNGTGKYKLVTTSYGSAQSKQISMV